MVLHSPTDNTVGIENASTIFQTARHPRSFVSLEGSDHLLTGKGQAARAGEDHFGVGRPVPRRRKLAAGPAGDRAWLARGLARLDLAGAPAGFSWFAAPAARSPSRTADQEAETR